jgi:hypothetical protein
VPAQHWRPSFCHLRLARSLLTPPAMRILAAALIGLASCGGDVSGPGGDDGGGPVADADPDAPDAGPPLPACEAPGPATFTVDPDVVLARNFVGYGGQMNNNLYAAITEAKGVTDENVGQVEAKVMALAPDHVRIFWDPDGDADRTQSFERVVELAQRAGATINITWWHGPYPDPDAQMKAFADELGHLIQERQLDAVRAITIQNEVNSTSIPQSLYEDLYRSLDSHLRAAGLRDQIDFVCGDLVRDGQLSWFQYMAANMTDVCDAWSIHIYWDYFDSQKLVDRLTEVRAIVNELPEAAHKPLQVTEFGVRGYRADGEPQPGHDEDGELIGRTNVNGFQHAVFNILSARLGYVATLKWDIYFAMYDDAEQYYNMIGIPPDFVLKPVYHATQAFTRTTAPGWDIVKVSGEQSAALVSALRGPRGDTTVFALNKDYGARRFSVTGLPPGVPFRVVVWHGAEADGGLTSQEIVSSDDCRVEFLVPKQSFAAVTTVDPGL